MVRATRKTDATRTKLFLFASVALLATATSVAGASTTCQILNSTEKRTGEFTFSLSAGGDQDWAVLEMAGAAPIHYDCPPNTDGCFSRDVIGNEAVDMVGLVNATTLVRAVTIVNAPTASTMLHYELSSCR